MWNSVKKYFSWNDNTSGNYDDELYEEKENKLDTMMECDQNQGFQFKSALAEIDQERRCDTQNYFDDEYLDLIIDEGEDNPKFSHLNSNEDYENFNELVEKAGIADLNSESNQNKDINETVTDSPVYKDSDADGFKNESQEDSESDLDNNSEGDSDVDNRSIKSKEREENVIDLSNYISDKNADVNENKSVNLMGTEETTCSQYSDSCEDKVKNVSNNIRPIYYSDILPDVSSDEVSDDEQLDTVPKRGEEFHKDETDFEKIKAMDSLSALSDMLNHEEKDEKSTEGSYGMLSSPVNNFTLENKPLRFNQKNLSLWIPEINMPELEYMKELHTQLRLEKWKTSDKSITEAEKEGENDQWSNKNKFGSPAKNMPELENGIDVDMMSCEGKDFLVSGNGTLEDTQKEKQNSVNLLPDKVIGDNKDITQKLKETPSIPSSQKNVAFHVGKMKELEVKTHLAKESSPNENNGNELSPKLSTEGYDPAILNEGGERKVLQNSFPTENNRESPCEGEVIPKSIPFLPPSSIVLKQDSNSDKRSQGFTDESLISHGLAGRNELSNEPVRVECKNSSIREQKSASQNKILKVIASEENASPGSVNDRTNGTFEKAVSVPEIRNEQEPKSERTLQQQSNYGAVANGVERNANESYPLGNTEVKLNSSAVSTTPRLEMGPKNTCGNFNNQNEELKNMCSRTLIQNHSVIENDFCHSSSRMLLPGTPPGRSSIGIVEMKMENGGIKLSITPSAQEVGNHGNGREMSTGGTFCNCSLVLKEGTGTQTTFGTESTRIQDQKITDVYQQKSVQPGIVHDRPSTAELGLQTEAVNELSRSQNLDFKSDAQQMSKGTLEKDKAEVKTLISGKKEPYKRAADLRVTSERTSESSFSSANPLISVAEIGTQVNEDWSYGSGSVSDKSLVTKMETATQTSMIESSKGQNAITISDLQQILEKIFGASHQSKSLPCSKSNVETQTTAPLPPFLAPSSSLNNPDMAGWNMNAVHNRLCHPSMLEGSDDGSGGRFHCNCPYYRPYQPDLSYPAPRARSTSQNNSTPNRGRRQIKKLLDLSRHSRLEFSPQTPTTVSKNLPNMMNQSQSAVECKVNSTSSKKLTQITVDSPQRITSSYTNCVVTPTSSCGSGAKLTTPVKVIYTGSKLSWEKTGQKSYDLKKCLNPGNTLRDSPGPSGINVTASPKKVCGSTNPVILISCPCSTPIAIEGRELVIGQRLQPVHPMIESTKGNTSSSNERVVDGAAKPAVMQYVSSPVKQSGLKIIQIAQSVLKPGSENNSDRKVTSISHLLNVLSADGLAHGRLDNSAKKDNDIDDKQGFEQTSNASPNAGEASTNCQTSSMSPKPLVKESNGSDLEVSSPIIIKSTDDHAECKSKEEAEEKKNCSMKQEDSPPSITPEQALEDKRQEISMIKEESCNENTPIKENAFKDKLTSDEISSENSEKGKKRRSSDYTTFEKKLSPLRSSRKREEAPDISSTSHDKKKKKVENDSTKCTKKTLIVPKSEEQLPLAECSRKRKYPMNNSVAHAKKKTEENNTTRSKGPLKTKKARTLRERSSDLSYKL